MALKVLSLVLFVTCVVFADVLPRPKDCPKKVTKNLLHDYAKEYYTTTVPKEWKIIKRKLKFTDVIKRNGTIAPKRACKSIRDALNFNLTLVKIVDFGGEWSCAIRFNDTRLQKFHGQVENEMSKEAYDGAWKIFVETTKV